MTSDLTPFDQAAIVLCDPRWRWRISPSVREQIANALMHAFPELEGKEHIAVLSEIDTSIAADYPIMTLLAKTLADTEFERALKEINELRQQKENK